jgi:hypothetical protein
MKKQLLAAALAFGLIACNTNVPDYSNGQSIPQSRCTTTNDGLVGGYKCLDVTFAEFNDFFAARAARDSGNNNQNMTFTGVMFHNRVVVRGDVESTNNRYRLATIYTPTSCQNNPSLICPQVIQYAVVDTFR